MHEYIGRGMEFPVDGKLYIIYDDGRIRSCGQGRYLRVKDNGYIALGPKRRAVCVAKLMNQFFGTPLPERKPYVRRAGGKYS